MTLPTAFIILLSALRVATAAAALSPDSIATNAFFVAVLTASTRDVLVVILTPQVLVSPMDAERNIQQHCGAPLN